jgi:hypothetical protein
LGSALAAEKLVIFFCQSEVKVLDEPFNQTNWNDIKTGKIVLQTLDVQIAVARQV